MTIRQIIHSDINKNTTMLNSSNKNTTMLNNLPKHNYKRENSIIAKIDEQLKIGHALCDNMILLIMKHRTQGVKLLEAIRDAVSAREYDNAENMLEKLDKKLQDLRQNSLLLQIKKDITDSL